MSKNNSAESKYSHDKAAALFSKKLGVASRQIAEVFKKKAHEIASNEKFRHGVNKQIANAEMLSEKFKVVSRNVAVAIKEKSNEVAAINMISQEINHRLTDAEVPDFIRQFLHTYWNKLLLKIYLKQGMETNAWKQSLIVIDDLAKLINTRYFISGADRVLKMDYLIQRLKNGMGILSLPSEIQEQFIRQITAYNKYLVNKANKIQSVNSTGFKSEPDITSEKAAKVTNQPFGNELFVDKIDNPRASKSSPTGKIASSSLKTGNKPLERKPVIGRKVKPPMASNPYYVGKHSTSKPAAAVPGPKSKQPPSSKDADLPFLNELLVDVKDKT